MRYLLRRFAHAIFLLLGVSLLSFAFATLAPGNYFDEMRLNPQISPDTVTALRAHYGVDRPMIVRYARWLDSVAHGDLGFSFAYNSPAAPLLWSRAWNTLLLTITATIFSWLIALPLGIWSAEKKARAPDIAITSVTGFLLAIPDLLLALGLLILAVRTGWFPTGGMVTVGSESLSWFARLRDLISHMALPVTALVLATLPLLVRHVRSEFRDAQSCIDMHCTLRLIR
jgi:peptide/nickel transport system permease protein